MQGVADRAHAIADIDFYADCAQPRKQNWALAQTAGAILDTLLAPGKTSGTRKSLLIHRASFRQ